MKDEKTDKTNTSPDFLEAQQVNNPWVRFYLSSQINIRKNEVKYGERIVELSTEQERTVIKKRAFLDLWEKSSGVVSYVCDKLDINRNTFYKWKADDPEFAAKIKAVEDKRLDSAEDILFGKVFVERDASCTKYLLDRKHPGYKPKSVTEVIAGEKTLEDLLAEDDAKADKELKEYERKHNNTKADGEKDEHSTDGTIQNQDQEGGNSQIQTESGADILSPKKDET